MNYQKYIDACELFYAAHHVPIFLYNDSDDLLFACSALDNFTPSYYIRKRLKSKSIPAVYYSTDTGFYGKIEIQGQNYNLILGPVFSGDISTEIVQAFSNINSLPNDGEENIFGFLMSIPKYSYYGFINLLSFLHFSVNGEKIDITKHFNLSDETYDKQIAQSHTESFYTAKENVSLHGTYDFELQMIDYVRLGKTDQLNEFLNKSVKYNKFQEGKLAENPIRQAKNIFIGVVTMVGKVGAIKGGLDVEQTYQLIDTYIQECEKLSSIDDIVNLQYRMLLDFTNRVAENQIPEGVSEDVFACIQFINNHTNDSIGIDDVANHIGKSRAYTTSKFKKEISITINDYILKQKLIEAKNLLRHTDKSLTEISYYLCFSSQSYFQNLFKKKFGITPLEYRKKHNKNI